MNNRTIATAALVEGSVVVGAVHLLGAAIFALHRPSEALQFALGALAGIALVWTLYIIALGCIWLRRKQVEGDQTTDNTTP